MWGSYFKSFNNTKKCHQMHYKERMNTMLSRFRFFVEEGVFTKHAL